LSLRFLQAQPDARLVELARQGHEPAFEALVRRYRKELLSYCRRMAHQTGTAEDTLQQALLQAWRALKAGAEVRDVRPWLYRIAHNVEVSNSRVAAATPKEIDAAAREPGVEQLVEQRFAARAALAGIASLPALQRQVIVSTTLDGASHEEIAQALGLSSGAVRGLIYRARAALRSAAAAVTPSPVLSWAVRHAEARGGGVPRVLEVLAGGGGAGAASLVLKGGAVITIAGAVAGAGGALLSETSVHHHRRQVHLVAPGLDSARKPGPSRGDGRPHLVAALAHPAPTGPRAVTSTGAQRHIDGSSSGSGSDRGGGRDGGSRSGPDGGSSGGSDGGATGSGGGTSGSSGGGSSGGTGGGSSSGTTTSTSGSGSVTSGGSDGMSGTSTTSGSSDGGTSTSGSGSDGGLTSGGPLATTTDGGSSSDGGTSTTSGSGSGGTTTTTATTETH
jgi:RNA polymerase sigma factor (sigma-70 family)